MEEMKEVAMRLLFRPVVPLSSCCWVSSVITAIPEADKCTERNDFHSG